MTILTVHCMPWSLIKLLYSLYNSHAVSAWNVSYFFLEKESPQTLKPVQLSAFLLQLNLYQGTPPSPQKIPLPLSVHFLHISIRFKNQFDVGFEVKIYSHVHVYLLYACGESNMLFLTSQTITYSPISEN